MRQQVHPRAVSVPHPAQLLLQPAEDLLDGLPQPVHLHRWTIPCRDGRCPYTRQEAFVAEGKRILGGVQVAGDEAAAVGLLLEQLGELRGVLDKGGITSSS